MIGTQFNVRDVSSVPCRRRKGVVMERLDRWDDRKECSQHALVEDKSCTPAELAASRIDFQEWLRMLPRRQRKIALKLAERERTCDVARAFGLSAARVSQLRSELHAAWEEFHERIPTDERPPSA
jgi:DNA-directed RNA polymerase specialized sigma subunit